MKTTATGKAAEAAVALWLEQRGYRVLAHNWRTRVCEIDVIASKDSVVYFVEVKFRKSDKQGEGFAYITPTKQRQMSYAAEIWNQQNSWDGDYRLLAASVDGAGYEDIKVVEI